jgi:hypothetical protein
MLKKYYSRAAAKDGEAKKDGDDGDASGFPAVENVFLIFGGPTVDMSNSQRKREQHEVLAAEKAPPYFLDWSGNSITFSREDHPNHVPNLGQYPLVVNPVIGNARFSKVLMDGGSSLNILYAHTFQLMSTSKVLVASMEKLVNEDLDSTAKHADSFEAVEQTKEVPLDPAAPKGKALRVSSTLDLKWELVLVDFLGANTDILKDRYGEPERGD